MCFNVDYFCNSQPTILDTTIKIQIRIYLHDTISINCEVLFFAIQKGVEPNVSVFLTFYTTLCDVMGAPFIQMRWIFYDATANCQAVWRLDGWG